MGKRSHQHSTDSLLHMRNKPSFCPCLTADLNQAVDYEESRNMFSPDFVCQAKLPNRLTMVACLKLGSRTVH